MGRRPPELREDSRPWLLGCGFFAGVLGGAYGMNGPPLVMYGAMRRWSPQHFRATLQGYFLPASIVVMTGYWITGLWTAAVTHYYLLALPVALPTIFLGRAARSSAAWRRVSEVCSLRAGVRWNGAVDPGDSQQVGYGELRMRATCAGGSVIA